MSLKPILYAEDEEDDALFVRRAFKEAGIANQLEETRQPAENPVEKVLRMGTVVGLANHTVLIAKDGTETPIDDSAAPIRTADGLLAGMVLVFRDFSEQKKAEGVRARLAAIIEFSGEAILTKNLDGIIQTWNAGAEHLFGYRPEEIIGRSIATLVPPDRLAEEDRLLNDLRQGKTLERLETIRIGKTGLQVPVAISVSPIKNGEGRVVGASKIIHDISEIVAAREALVREKELLATTLASIGDAVIVTDGRGAITFLNPEAERLTGWRSQDAAGQQSSAVFRIVNEETRQPVENPVDVVLRLGTIVGLANHTILIRRDGAETPIDDSAAPIRRGEGPLLGVVLVFRDFTDRKNTEKRLAEQARLLDLASDAILVRDLNDKVVYWNNGAEEALKAAQQELQLHTVKLEETVSERTAKLRETIGELEAFSYSIAHDMRAPLRSLQGYGQFLAEEYSHQLDATGQDYIRRLTTSAARMDRLIQDILNYSCVVRSEWPLEPVDVEKLLHDIVDSYPALQNPDTTIRLDGPFPKILGNEAALTQCCSNLLGNAVKFVAPDVKPVVRVWTETHDPYLRLLVQDNGIGIEPDQHERIFAIFQRVSKGYEGTGIGLAIVKKAAERMGGRVGLKSEPGKGSTFWIDLQPAHPEALNV